MDELIDDPEVGAAIEPQSTSIPARMTGWISGIVALACLIATLWVSMIRSTGLVAVTVTALEPDNEPTDHKLPLIKQHEALPDYELTVIGTRWWFNRHLGVKPDESAAAGLTWQLTEPVSVGRIASVRLRERDALLTDAVAEVQLAGASAESNGYRFEFQTEQSLGIGMEAFFKTPLGVAITSAFTSALVIIIRSTFLSTKRENST